MTNTQFLILVAVGSYFAIGAFIAHGVTRVSLGFTGKFEPMAIAAFFAWPFIYLMMNGPLALAIPFIVAVGAMVGLAYWLTTIFL